MLLSTTIKKYLDFNYQLDDRTVEIYQSHLERLCSALDDPPIDQVDHFTMADFMKSLRKQNGKRYAPGYLDQIYRSIHTYFEFCVEEGWIAKNPMDRLKHPKVATGRKPRLSLEQVQRLLDAVRMTAAGERNLAMILLMVDCGLRSGEVVGLAYGDVDFDAGRLLIRAEKTSVTREVPLSEMAGVALDAYLAKRRPFKSVCEPLFLTYKGPRKGQGISRKVIEELMKRLQKKLGFPLHAHLLRHTFGNHYIRKGGLKYLQKILGHSRIDTTARFYTDPEFEDIKAEHRQASPTAQLGEE